MNALTTIPAALLLAATGVLPWPTTEANSGDADIPIERIIYYFDGDYSYALIGNWERKPEVGGAERCTPVGTEAHSFKYTRNGVSDNVSVASTGDIVVMQRAAVIDRTARGKIEVGGHQSLASNAGANDGITRLPYCDTILSGVKKVTLSGGCWGNTLTEPGTGAWSTRCSKDNGMGCTATVTFTDGSEPETYTWDCNDPSPVTGNYADGNNSTGAATMHHHQC